MNSKMVRAEKKGTTIGPTFGSPEEDDASTDIVGKRTIGLKLN
jgi:hypothetical protein